MPPMKKPPKGRPRALDLALLAENPLSAAALILAVIAGLWFSFYVVHDDGLIYLRYARNLAEGHGLVYNPGEYYESNTAFLWSVLLALPFLSGIDPFFYLRVLSAVILAGALALTWLACARIDSPRIGFLAVALLGTHFSFIVFCNSGFAPHLQSFWALAALCLCLRFARVGDALTAAGIGLCLFLLMLTRLDSAIFFAVLFALAAFLGWRQKSGRARNLALMCALPSLLFVVFLLLKFRFYGDILPATYYAKAGDGVPASFRFFHRGVLYLWAYLLEYWLLLLLPLFIYGGWKRFSAFRAAFKRTRKKKARTPPLDVWHSNEKTLATLACAAIVALWSLYILRIGGGYIEFRFMAPMAPFLFILIARALSGLDWRLIVGSAAVLIFASFYHQAVYERAGDGLALRAQNSFLLPQKPAQKKAWRDRIEAGLALRDLFRELGDYPQEARIALTSGGWIPFYSRLYALEMHGWADTRVFDPKNHVAFAHPQPGHQRLANPDFLRERKINLVLGSLISVPMSEDLVGQRGIEALVQKLSEMFFKAKQFAFPKDMQIVELPVGGGQKIYALYFLRNDVLDDLFSRKNIIRHDVYPAARCARVAAAGKNLFGQSDGHLIARGV